MGHGNPPARSRSLELPADPAHFLARPSIRCIRVLFCPPPLQLDVFHHAHKPFQSQATAPRRVPLHARSSSLAVRAPIAAPWGPPAMPRACLARWEDTASCWAPRATARASRARPATLRRGRARASARRATAARTSLRPIRSPAFRALPGLPARRAHLRHCLARRAGNVQPYECSCAGVVELHAALRIPVGVQEGA